MKEKNKRLGTEWHLLELDLTTQCIHNNYTRRNETHLWKLNCRDRKVNNLWKTPQVFFLGWLVRIRKNAEMTGTMRLLQYKRDRIFSQVYIHAQPFFLLLTCVCEERKVPLYSYLPPTFSNSAVPLMCFFSYRKFLCEDS